MARRTPTAVRFDAAVADRLAGRAAAHTGLSLSSAANRLVDEALRADEHPGIVFRAGPAGRRAGVAAGPDVWGVIRSVRSARAADPDLSETATIELVARNAGMPVRQVQAAVTYWSDCPDEVDDEIRANERAEEPAAAALRRRDDLLRRP